MVCVLDGEEVMTLKDKLKQTCERRVSFIEGVEEKLFLLPGFYFGRSVPPSCSDISLSHFIADICSLWSP